MIKSKKPTLVRNPQDRNASPPQLFQEHAPRHDRACSDRIPWLVEVV